MGFFADMKLTKKYKQGIKEAMNGNFNGAISLFDVVHSSASDLKFQMESVIWLHICKALHYAKSGDFIRGKEKYKECDEMITVYIETCSLTPGIGTETRVIVWKKEIGKFINKYEKQLDLLK